MGCELKRERLQSEIVTDDKEVTNLKGLLDARPGTGKPNLFDESRLQRLQQHFQSLKASHSAILDRMNGCLNSNPEMNQSAFDRSAKLITDFKNTTANIIDEVNRKKRKLANIKTMVLSHDQSIWDQNSKGAESAQFPEQQVPPSEADQEPHVLSTLKEEPEEEEDCRTYLVDKDFREELQEVRQSFIVPVRDNEEEIGPQHTVLIDKEMEQMADQILPRASFKVVIHPLVNSLLKTNSAYQQYPVIESAPSRKRLPALRDPTKKVNVWTILKENIGKDLSKMSMPVYAKEPITLLQKMAEFLEYRHFLRQANREQDSIMRLVYVTSFYLMWVSQNKFRLAASFNSLLCETYEFIEGDMKFIFELVNNHPPIAACYGICDDFIVESDFHIKFNFSLSGFEIETLGKFEITLRRTNEKFLFHRPKVTIHNFIFGDLYMWLKGDLQIENAATKEKVVIKFRPKGWSSKHDREITGAFYNSAGNEQYLVSGRWDSHMNIQKASGGPVIEICRKFEDPEKFDWQYFFNTFAINANYKTVDSIPCYPPTESRLRPDVHAYENGDFEIASFEKNRLEEAQRARRKSKMNQEPFWFTLNLRNERNFTTSYKGGYFEARESGRWPAGLCDLYNK